MPCRTASAAVSSRFGPRGGPMNGSTSAPKRGVQLRVLARQLLHDAVQIPACACASVTPSWSFPITEQPRMLRSSSSRDPFSNSGASAAGSQTSKFSPTVVPWNSRGATAAIAMRLPLTRRVWPSTPGSAPKRVRQSPVRDDDRGIVGGRGEAADLRLEAERAEIVVGDQQAVRPLDLARLPEVERHARKASRSRKACSRARRSSGTRATTPRGARPSPCAIRPSENPPSRRRRRAASTAWSGSTKRRRCSRRCRRRATRRPPPKVGAFG